MRRCGFTLIETLIALALVAVVVPLALAGISAATQAASQVRKQELARRVAESRIARLASSGEWSTSAESGTCTAADDGDEADGLTWKLDLGTWRDGTTRILTLTVSWDASDPNHGVALTTLVTPATTTSTSTASGG
jgi:type II secretion system protein I